VAAAVRSFAVRTAATCYAPALGIKRYRDPSVRLSHGAAALGAQLPHSLLFVLICIVAFAVAVLEPILEADKAEDYLAIHVNPTLLRGLSELCKHKPSEPVVSLRLLKSVVRYLAYFRLRRSDENKLLQ